jgi:hypothetical protein
MTNIANHPWLTKSYVLVELISAMGVIFLGAMLFTHVRKYNEKIALVGLGFYILEAVIGVIGKLDIFSLLPSARIG